MPGHANNQHFNTRCLGSQASSGQVTRPLAWPGRDQLRTPGARPCTAPSCLHPPGMRGPDPALPPPGCGAGSPAHTWLRGERGQLLCELCGLPELGPSEPQFPHLQSGWPVHVAGKGGAGESRRGQQELGGPRLLHDVNGSTCPAVPVHQESHSSSAVVGSEQQPSPERRAVELPRPGSHPWELMAGGEG